MADYYDQNSLKPNPSKTQVSAFHLRNREATIKLNVLWRGSSLEHTETPKYLGVILDRTLTYKYHCQKTRQKVNARNNILRRLTGSKWGANPSVLRTTARALCFSTGEYACPVWSRSSHAKQVDVALNETCRITTGCMKATSLPQLYRASGFAAPPQRRKATEYTEMFKQMFDDRHPLYGEFQGPSRLRSRKNFLKAVPENISHLTEILNRSIEEYLL